MSDIDTIAAMEGSTAHLWEKAHTKLAVVASGKCARLYHYWVMINNNPNQRMQIYYRGTLTPGTRVEVCLDPYRQRGNGTYIVTRVL